jgi:hypothetical protein
MTPTRFAPARRQLEAYEESWKRDHEAAMLCQDTEDLLAAGIMVVQLLYRTEQSWCDRVFRGVEAYDAADEAILLQCFRDWLAVTEAVLASLQAVERHLPPVSNRTEAEENAARVRLLLADWHSPTLSKAVGLRESQLTAEAAGDLRSILDRAPGPETGRSLRRLPAADPSLLTKRSS